MDTLKEKEIHTNTSKATGLSFMEVQFPVSKISKESYKERKAGQSQTLTGLGKWWGRKPLILVRATILGLLMPATDDPIKDREIFLKILMMDSDGIWSRKNKAIKDATIIENLSLKELKEYFEVPVDLFSEEVESQEKLIRQAIRKNSESIDWKKGLSKQAKEKATKLAFDRLSYDDRLEYCLRPEETKLDDKAAWIAINQHLGTNSTSLAELMRELGKQKFGYVPTVGDCFAGGGSIPFEAARIGLKSYASDLNPLAGLLTWAGLNILSLAEEEISKHKELQIKIYDSVAKEIDEIGIEKNQKGWIGKYYLYCTEVKCLECSYKVPLLPSYVVSKREKTIVKLKKNELNKNYDFIVIENASDEEFKMALNDGTVKDYELHCPNCKSKIPIPLIRKDRPELTSNTYRYSTPNDLRFWDEDDFIPKPDDILQERLYCIKYIELKKGKTWLSFYKKPGPATDATYGKVHYVAPSNDDLENENRAIKYLKERIVTWKKKGFIPAIKIIEGDNTNQPKYEKGWTYWHHLFNPRQLLVLGLFLETVEKFTEGRDKTFLVNSLISFNALADRSSKLCRWDAGGVKGQQVYYNQALNTFFNYATRGLSALFEVWVTNLSTTPFKHDAEEIQLLDARKIKKDCDYWITDPPYADAVHYHELTEYFLAWDKKFIEKNFPDWYVDSKRVLAVKGTGETFNQSMIEIYRNLAKHMPDNGMQIVMFTHQDPAVWADLTLILWSACLHVTAAWNIATETESGGLKEGNYVKGTVLLVLRKLTSNETAFTDEITFEIQEEVKRQIDSMRALEDKEDPNFSDADYLLAAYAATLKILTGYRKIGDINVEYELSKPRDAKNVGPVEAIIVNAIRTAYDYLIPQAFDSYIWKNLTPEERFFIKGMELEKSNVYQLGAYQEMARGFGVKDFKALLASTKANQVRFKIPAEFGNRNLGSGDEFGSSLLRQVLMAINQSEKEQNGQAGRAWLKNEVEDYWNKRQTIIELLRYLSTTEHIDHMQHWESPALYAKYLVALVSSDGV